jgi:hypothetical protein
MNHKSMHEDVIKEITPLLSEKTLRIFIKILKRSTYIEYDKENYTLKFDHDELDLSEDEIFCFRVKRDIYSIDSESRYFSSKVSLKNALDSNAVWSFGSSGDIDQLMLSDGINGTLHTIGSDVWNERKTGFPYSKEICSPIDIGLNAFVYIHPESGKIFLYDEVVEELEIEDPVEFYLGLVLNRV